MPHIGEGSSRTAQVGILIEPDELRNQYFREARTHRGHDEDVARIISSMFIPYDMEIADVDNCAGIDGSTYEGSFDDADANQGGYPSSRIGIVQIAHQGVDIQKLGRLSRSASHGACINPKELMSALGGVGALDFWFCSSNMVPEGALSARDGFREALCNALRKPQARLPSCASDEGREVGWSLMTVYHHLLHRMDRLGLLKDGPLKVDKGAVYAIECRECKVEGRSDAISPVLLDPNRRVGQQARCKQGHVLTEIELIGLPEEFNDEIANYTVFHKFGMFVEILRAFQILLAQSSIKPPGEASVRIWPDSSGSPMGVSVLVDGPLTMMNHFQVLIPAMRSVMNDFLSSESLEIPDQGVIFGVIKTGVVWDFISAVNSRAVDDSGLRPAISSGSFWVVDPKTRSRWIMRQGKGPDKIDEVGPETHLGHEIAVKTHRGQLFLLSVPLPLPPLPETKDSQKVLRKRYAMARKALNDPQSPQRAYLNRVLSILETVQSFLFGASTVPQIVAHNHASLSWHPAGEALMAAVRKAMKS